MLKSIIRTRDPITNSVIRILNAYSFQAGVPNPIGEQIEQCFKQYSVNCAIDALKHEIGIHNDKDEVPFKQQQMYNSRNQGLLTGASECLKFPVKSRFEQIIDDLKSTSYSSYWKKPLGEMYDYTHMIPKGMDPVATTFGKPTKRCRCLKLISTRGLCVVYYV